MSEQQSTTGQACLDLQQAFDFVKAVAGVGGTVCWQTFDDDRSRGGKDNPEKRKELTRVFNGSFTKASLAESLTALKQLNLAGAGIFVTISATDGKGRKTKNVVAVRAFYVEFDAKDGQVAPETWPLEPSIVVQSKGGVHVYWLVSDAPLSEFARVQKELIKKFGSDPVIHNPDRVMRVPGFLHVKDPGDPFLVELVACEPERRYTHQDFCVAMGIEPVSCAAANTPAQEGEAEREDDVVERHDVAVVDLPPLDVRLERLHEYLAAYPPAVEGQHGDEQTFKLGKTLGDFGVTVHEAWPLVLEWNARCSPPWDEAELRDKLQRALDNRQGPLGSRFAREGAAAGRPTVRLTSDLDGIVEQTVARVADLPGVFVRGTVVELGRDQHGAVVIRAAGVHRLQQILSKAARFTEPTERRGWVPVRAPLWLARCVAEHPLDRMRHLRGVVDTPVLRRDGTVLDVPGYDEATGLFLTGDLECPEVPDAPTRDDARAAIAALLDVVCDFPFRSPADRSAWLSGVLTVIGRPAIAGPTPMLGIEGNIRGSGKGLLADTIAIMATGRRVPTMTYSSDDAELRKAVTAKLLEAPALVLFDNVAGTIGSPVLDALLTTETWEDRILGVSRVARLANATLWMMTANNPSLRGDLVRRLLPARLVSPEEHPEHRTGFRHADLRAHVLAHRGELVVAALTMLRAFVVAGRPAHGLHTFGSFEAWSDLVRGAIVWCGEADPLGSRVHLEQVADAGTGELASLLGAWECAQVRLRVAGMTAKEAMAHAEMDTELNAAIISAGVKPSSPKSLGKYLGSVRERVVDGRRLVPTGDGHGTLVWSVVRVDGPTTKPDETTPDDEAGIGDEHGIDQDAILATMMED